ncbi:MAG: methylase [Microbacteriaceae bacterium]|nr:methylase [Microbacteriaceae bacterium]
MPTPSSSESLIAERLRAAGCVFAEDEARLLLAAPAAPAELEAMVARRVAGQPLEHILGWAEFCGLRVGVAPGVFVPRRRTEFLALEAIALAAPGAVVLDLCCGSGALGAAVAAAVPRVELFASDIEPAAVHCARRNLPRAAVFEGDLFEPLPRALRGRIDVLLCNTPYVPTDEIRMLPPEARDFEPRVTLDGGVDGLDVQRRVAVAAGEWLAPGGHALVEVGEHQAVEAAAIFSREGLAARLTSSDEYSATLVVATRRRAAL